MFVAVSRTLKREMVNHQLLVGSRFVDEDRLANIVLHELMNFQRLD